MNENAKDLALYAGVGGAGLVGGHLAYTVASDKIAVRREMKAKEAAMLEKQQKAPLNKGAISHLFTRGR